MAFDPISYAMLKKAKETPIIPINPAPFLNSLGSGVPLENGLVGMTKEEAIAKLEHARVNQTGLRIKLYMSSEITMIFESSVFCAEEIDFGGVAYVGIPGVGNTLCFLKIDTWDSGPYVMIKPLAL